MLLLLLSIIATLVLSVFVYRYVKRVDSSINLLLSSYIHSRPDHYFHNKVIWIVGASSGIGESLTYHLASTYPSCHLILSARREPLLHNVKRNCLQSSTVSIGDDQIAILPFDMVDIDRTAEIVSKAEKIFDRPIDIVILNAGQSQRADAWSSIDASVDMDCFKLNALGPTVLARHLVPSMIKRRNGHFAVVSSLAGVIGAPMSPSYVAAKHALNGYFRSLAIEHCNDGITVTIVCPGMVFAPNILQNAFTGKQGQKHGEILTSITDAHMSSERAAELIALSIGYRLSEVWISKTKIPLLFSYLCVICPDLAIRMIILIGADRMRRMRTGGK